MEMFIYEFVSNAWNLRAHMQYNMIYKYVLVNSVYTLNINL